MGIIAKAMSLPRTVILALFFLLFVGAYAYISIPKESQPDVSIPIIYVTLSQEGISPLDSERLLVRPIEEKLQSIEGVKEMRSEAYEGGGYVLLEFDAGFDSNSAYTDVLEEIDSVKGDLPSEADDPVVHEVTLSETPILVIGVTSVLPEKLTGEIVEAIADKIETLSEVLEARVRGKRAEQVVFEVTPERLDYYGLDVREVVSIFQGSNLVAAAGRVQVGSGEFALTIPGLFETVDDVLNVPLMVNGDAVVRVKDVAEVRRTFEDAKVYARYNGINGMAIEVIKRSGENIIITTEKVKAIVEEARKIVPEGIEFIYNNDQSTFIANMLSELQNSVLLSVILVMIVVVVSLGIRGGIIVSLAIPGAFLSGVLALYALGFTVNMVVLFALILSVGLLVDGAIVMTEYADREMSNGISSRLAYQHAAERMSWPIIASTLTTLAAFFPLMFWPGIVGEFMQYLPLTLIFVLTSSLLMALLFMPVLGANLVMVMRIILISLATVLGFVAGRAILSSVLGEESVLPSIVGVVLGLLLARVLWQPVRSLCSKLDNAEISSSDGHALPDLDNLRGVSKYYADLLYFCVKTNLRAGMTVMVAVIALVIGWYSYIVYGHGIEFFPDMNPEQLTVSVSARGNLTVDAKDRLVREVENRILAKGVEEGEFKAVYTSSGNVQANRDQDRKDLIGKIFIELTDWDIRRSGFVIEEELVELTSDIRGIIVEVSHQKGGPPQGKSIDIQVRGENIEDIKSATRRVLALVNSHEGLRSIQDDLPLPGIEWRLSVDRAEASKYGFNISIVSSFVRLITGGAKLSTYRPDDSSEEIDIRIRFPEEYRTLDQLDDMKLSRGSGGDPIPLSHFVTREVKSPTGGISRIDGVRLMSVKADTVEGYNVDAVTGELRAEIDEISLPEGIEVRYSGQNQDQQEAQEFLSRAFLVAIFLICGILVTQFNSFYKTFIILSAVIISTTGVGIGLLILGQPFSIIMSGIGVISLAGIVVNNNIVLIDTYNHARKRESDPTKAILYTGVQRLRPVLLTTVTTILGLLPMALRVNMDFISKDISIGAPSSAFWQQLSTAVVCGLSLATLLTLLVTPSLLRLGSLLRSGHGHKGVQGGPSKELVNQEGT